MTIQETTTLHHSIVSHIQGQQLNRAIDELEQLVGATPDATLHERIDQVRMSYSFMLRYLSQGILDPERDNVLSHIINELSTIADMCLIALSERESPEVFYARRRELGATPLAVLAQEFRTQLNKLALLRSVNDDQRDQQTILQMTKACERAATNLFNKVWSTFPISQGDSELLGQLIADASLPEPVRCLLVMALMLGLMKFYDERKLELLIDCYVASDSAEVQIRALIAVLLALNCHRARARQSRGLQRHIDAMTETPAFASDMAMVLYRIVATRNTEHVTHRVTQEIMPDIMKATPDLISKLRQRDEIDPDELEANPEWQKMLEDNGIASKMEEFSQMQQDGSDVFISTFARLKTFPFFHTLSNWFLPYHSDHSVVVEAFGTDERILSEMVARAPFLCNSDRYSFALTLSNMPPSQRQMILTQTRQQMEGLDEELDEELAEQVIKNRNMNRDTIATRCVQDLYRFFNLFSRRREFIDAFASHVSNESAFMNVPYLEQYTDSAEALTLIGEFYLKNELYHEASICYERLLHTQDNVDPIVLQKAGYAHECESEFDEAISMYERYLLAYDDDVWTLKHLARCHEANGDFDKAVPHYEHIDRLQPNRVGNTLNLGYALMRSGRLDEAMQQYFKADLMDDTKHRAWRHIAWCAFLQGNDERSLDYYTRIINDGKPRKSDYINRGHVHLCKGLITDAIADYRRARPLCDGGIDELQQLIAADIAELEMRGMTPSDVYLIIDTLLMNDE